jgi:hypothetical protein
VTLLKDAQITVETIAGPDAQFTVTLTNLAPGTYNFGIFGTDQDGVTSALQTFPVTIARDSSTSVSGIFIVPTIGVSDDVVEQGENIAIFGQSVPSGTVTIVVNSEEAHFVQAATDSDGTYLYNFDTTPLEQGDHTTASKATLGNEISTFGRPVAFVVGQEGLADPSLCNRADLSCDGRVNLVDFAIAAHWYNQPLSAEFAARESQLLNGDGIVNLIDFAIMSFYWTG